MYRQRSPSKEGGRFFLPQGVYSEKREVMHLTLPDLKPGRYRHFKGGEYELLGVARHSETLEPMVVYRALYGEGGLWVRPADMWCEHVEREGCSGPRFTYVGA